MKTWKIIISFCVIVFIFANSSFALSWTVIDSSFNGLAGFTAGFSLGTDTLLDIVQSEGGSTNIYNYCYKNIDGTNFQSTSWPYISPDSKHGEFGYTNFKNATPSLLYGPMVATGMAAGGLTNLADLYTYSSFGDYNNDGKLDIAIIGAKGEADSCFTYIFQNTGSSFSGPIVLPNSNNGTGIWEAGYVWGLAWADFDKDGDLDLVVLSTSPNAVHGIKLFVNENGTLVDETLQRFPPDTDNHVARSAIWVDFNCDGWLDLRVDDYLYINHGGYFTRSPIVCPDAKDAYAVGDLDNDGYPDFISYPRTGHVFLNRGDTIISGGGGVQCSEGPENVILGDFGNNGKLDAFVNGPVGYKGFLYRSDVSIKNKPPSVPVGLTTKRLRDTVYFSWNESTDDLTPAPALSYSLLCRNRFG